VEEIEVRFLNINPSDLEAKLIKLKAEKISDEMFEEWLFSQPEWEKSHGRVRLRKQSQKIELSYKETTQATSKGNLEIEFTVNNETAALEFLNKLGFKNPRHQQKRRVHFVLGDISIDIDFWPKIPPCLEIEGPNLKQIREVVKKLGLDMKDRCELDAFQTYKQIYGIDLTEVTELVF